MRAAVLRGFERVVRVSIAICLAVIGISHVAWRQQTPASSSLLSSLAAGSSSPSSGWRPSDEILWDAVVPTASAIADSYVEIKGRSVSSVHSEILTVPGLGDANQTISYCLEVCDLNRLRLGCSHVEVLEASTGRCVLRRGPPRIATQPSGGGRMFLTSPKVTSAETIQILFGMLAGAPHVTHRVVPALHTWLREERVLVLFEIRNDTYTPGYICEALNASGLDCCVPESDAFRILPSLEQLHAGGYVLPPVRNPRGAGEVHVAFVAPPADATLASFGAAWKDFALLELMHSVPRVAPLAAKAAFVVLCDDDSYMLMPTLRWTLAHLDPRASQLMGLLATSRGTFSAGGDTHWQSVFARLNNSDQQRPVISNVQGGAGIVISRAAVDTIAPSEGVTAPLWKLCAAYCRQWAGDIRVGCCFSSLGTAELVYHGGFHHHTLEDGINHARHVVRSKSDAVTFPVTFHDVRSALMFRELEEAVNCSNHRSPLPGLVAWRDMERCYAASHPWYHRRPFVWDPRLVVA
jgi:hypothetical protein